MEASQPQRMPAPVIAAVAITALFVVLGTVNNVMQHSGWIMSACVGSLVLFGLLRGHPLAWQWGRIIPVVLLVYTVGTGLLISLSDKPGVHAAAMAGTVAAVVVLLPFLALPILLSTSSAKRFFGLECPSCHALTASAGSFLFNKYRCPHCDHRWPYTGRA